MYSNVCRIISYCILSVSVYVIILLPFADDQATQQYVADGLAFLLLPVACWQWKKIGPYKRRAWMSVYPAVFRPDMIDCYVRFTGNITSEKAHRLPLSYSECAFYIASVVAEWQTKAKKPDSGMETQRKPLLREQSADELRLEGRGGPVYVRVEDFSGNWLELRKREKTQEKCPPQVTGKAESKYTTYRLVERYLEHGEMVAVQGRLTRNADGRLFIKPTKRLEFPSFVVVKERLDQLTGTLAAQADHKVWVQRINAGFLVINALVLCSLWK